jgi:hypothetical protein
MLVFQLAMTAADLATAAAELVGIDPFDVAE